MIKLIIFLVLIAGAFYFGYEQGLSDAVCVKTQNTLSTPYLTDPNNLDGELSVLVVQEYNTPKKT